MELFLMRHGAAVARGTKGYDEDRHRPLLAAGAREVKAIAKSMRAWGLEFDLILSSPYVRARQTAEIVAAGIKPKGRVKLSDDLTPNGDIGDLLHNLKSLVHSPDRLLLVGHAPHLGLMISFLLTGSEAGAVIELKKAGLCKLEANRLRAGRCASLCWLLTPRQLLRMS